MFYFCGEEKKKGQYDLVEKINENYIRNSNDLDSFRGIVKEEYLVINLG